jgi:hypothetical protein
VDDAGARYPVTVDPVVQEFTLQASDGATGDELGKALAISGDTAIVGAPSKNNSMGAAYVFVRAGNTWTQQQKLTASDGLLGDNFGLAVALDGDTAVVGSAPGATGAAYVFTRSSGSWSQQAKLTNSGASTNDRFGSAVAVSGDTAVVGAPSGRGQAYVFVRSAAQWPLQTKLTGFAVPGFNYSEFGKATAISGDTALIGAPGNNTGDSGCGAAFVFVRAGTVWSAQSRLSAPDEPSACLHWTFGAAVALDADTALVGAPFAQMAGVGAAYFFTRSAGAWTLQTEVTASDAAAPDLFGHAVALRDGAAVVGASGKTLVSSTNAGAAYLFTRFANTWTQQLRFDPAVPQTTDSRLGSAVGISRDTAVVGAPGSINSSAGLASVFRLSNVTLEAGSHPQTFTLSGAGCGDGGTFLTPYSGFWSTCTVQWINTATANTRYFFSHWFADSSSTNPRTFTLNPDPHVTTSLGGKFAEQYLVAVQAIPHSGGSVSGGGWLDALTVTQISATPNPGFIFTGFTGSVFGPLPLMGLIVKAPYTINANFTNTPPAALSGMITAKSGPAESRLWTISLTNTGPGTAFGAQVYVLSFAQTYGAACTAAPIRLLPSLPATVGNLAPGATAQVPVTIDFSACPLNARFTVGLGYVSNGGAYGGLIQLVNQIQ